MKTWGLLLAIVAIACGCRESTPTDRIEGTANADSAPTVVTQAVSPKPVQTNQAPTNAAPQKP